MYLPFDMATWSWPQWFMFSLYVLNVVLVAFIHDHKRTGKHSFPITLVTSAIGMFVLMAGGFFGA